MKNLQKLLTFLWNALFFSHYDIEENQRKRSIKTAEKKVILKDASNITDKKSIKQNKPYAFFVISLLVIMPISLILVGSWVVEAYAEKMGIEIVFFLFLLAAGILPCIIVQKVFYPNDN